MILNSENYFINMYLLQTITNLSLFLIGTIGIVFNNRSILIVIMCIEVILLSVNMNFIICSTYMDDFIGQIFALIILTVAAAESAIGLAIIILFFRLKGNISLKELTNLKG